MFVTSQQKGIIPGWIPKLRYMSSFLVAFQWFSTMFKMGARFIVKGEDEEVGLSLHSGPLEESDINPVYADCKAQAHTIAPYTSDYDENNQVKLRFHWVTPFLPRCLTNIGSNLKTDLNSHHMHDYNKNSGAPNGCVKFVCSFQLVGNSNRAAVGFSFIFRISSSCT